MHHLSNLGPRLRPAESLYLPSVCIQPFYDVARPNCAKTRFIRFPTAVSRTLMNNLEDNILKSFIERNFAFKQYSIPLFEPHDEYKMIN